MYQQTFDFIDSVAGLVKKKRCSSKVAAVDSPWKQVTIFDLIEKLKSSFVNQLEHLKGLFKLFSNPVGKGVAVPASQHEWDFVERRAREIQAEIDFIDDWLFEFSEV